MAIETRFSLEKGGDVGPLASSPATQINGPEGVATAMRRLHRVLDTQQPLPVEGATQDPAVGLQVRGHVVRDLSR